MIAEALAFLESRRYSVRMFVKDGHNFHDVRRGNEQYAFDSDTLVSLYKAGKLNRAGMREAAERLSRGEAA